MAPNDIHAVLLKEAARRSLPAHYERDLRVHDLAEITESGTEHFIWVLRTCGTHLVKLDRRGTDLPRQIVSAIGGDNEVYFFHFAHGTLTEVTREEAERICSQTLREV